jgi:hypothetical protein
MANFVSILAMPHQLPDLTSELPLQDEPIVPLWFFAESEHSEEDAVKWRALEEELDAAWKE